MTENALKLKILIEKPKKVVITTHRSPDGDAMGSSLAMSLLLKKIGHTVNVITPNNYANFLHWIPGNEDVIIYEESKEEAERITKHSDLIFLMDLNHISRVADFRHSINDSNAKKILIDHHQDPDMGIADIIFSDPKACSTAQLVYEIINTMKLNCHIDKSIAECIYTGIMTDTGSFKYPSTTARTHKIVSELISIGANNTKIHDLVYDNSSANRMKLLGYCLNEKLLLYPENNSAIISLNSKELVRFRFQQGDTEGIINYALAIKGIRFAVFVVEKEGIVKLSLRSKGNFKVNEIANKYFQGGGHTNAAGGISQVSVNETIKNIEDIIKTHNKELKN